MARVLPCRTTAKATLNSRVDASLLIALRRRIYDLSAGTRQNPASTVEIRLAATDGAIVARVDSMQGVAAGDAVGNAAVKDDVDTCTAALTDCAPGNAGTCGGAYSRLLVGRCGAVRDAAAVVDRESIAEVLHRAAMIQHGSGAGGDSVGSVALDRAALHQCSDTALDPGRSVLGDAQVRDPAVDRVGEGESVSSPVPDGAVANGEMIDVRCADNATQGADDANQCKPIQVERDVFSQDHDSIPGRYAGQIRREVKGSGIGNGKGQRRD